MLAFCNHNPQFPWPPPDPPLHLELPPPPFPALITPFPVIRRHHSTRSMHSSRPNTIRISLHHLNLQHTYITSTFAQPGVSYGFRQSLFNHLLVFVPPNLGKTHSLKEEVNNGNPPKSNPILLRFLPLAHSLELFCVPLFVWF